MNASEPARKPRVAFVGAGRLATALAAALDQAGYPVTAVASRSPASAATLAAALQHPDLPASSSDSAAVAIHEVADGADLVFLTVPDDAIVGVAGMVRWRSGVLAVHCSGAAGLEVLAPAARQGADIGSFHPLQTFAGHQVDLAGIAVAVEGSESVMNRLEAVATDLGCRPLRLPPGGKALYHASAAFASNYLVTLIAEAVRLWQLLGCGGEEALQAIVPLVKSTIANVERLGPRDALTGPIARGDTGTVCRHLEALAAGAPDLVELYRQLGLHTLPLAGPAAQHLSAILEGDSSPCA